MHGMGARAKTYCVWNNQTDQITALDETAKRCAELMGITRNAFYGYISGTPNKLWTIIESKQISESEEKRDMNQVTIIGNLTKAPELRTTASGVSVCGFTVAVNRKKTQNNQDPGTDYFNVTAWRQLGENCAKFLEKGKKVCVIGQISLRTWETDTKHGASLEVKADEIEFLSPRVSDPEPIAEPTAPKDQQSGMNIVETDDLPF